MQAESDGQDPLVKVLSLRPRGLGVDWILQDGLAPAAAMAGAVNPPASTVAVATAARCLLNLI
jgi:hypothetical protein